VRKLPLLIVVSGIAAALLAHAAPATAASWCSRAGAS